VRSIKAATRARKIGLREVFMIKRSFRPELFQPPVAHVGPVCFRAESRRREARSRGTSLGIARMMKEKGRDVKEER
jgi:hypothetical protein